MQRLLPLIIALAVTFDATAATESVALPGERAFPESISSSATYPLRDTLHKGLHAFRGNPFAVLERKATQLIVSSISVLPDQAVPTAIRCQRRSVPAA